MPHIHGRFAGGVSIPSTNQYERGSNFSATAFKILVSLGGSSGQVAVSALGSGRACPTAVIAFCPSGRNSALSQCESCSREQFSCLQPLHLRALRALLGQAYIFGGGGLTSLKRVPEGHSDAFWTRFHIAGRMEVLAPSCSGPLVSGWARAHAVTTASWLSDSRTPNNRGLHFPECPK